ncbi:MAG: ribonuclease III [Ruminococcus sp.]|jgi:ribonuclease-3 family protein|nr:ribonuclease III [Ruminococcus sp.]
MEKGITFEFYDQIREVLGLPETDVDSYSPLVLAYMGDCVYDLIIKSMVVSRGNKQVHRMHEETSSYVQASAQSRMMRAMQPHLTEEEHAIYRRGRNTRSVSAAKNQTITDYRRATGFEALVGYLFLKKRYARLMELVKIGLDSLEEKE